MGLFWDVFALDFFVVVHVRQMLILLLSKAAGPFIVPSTELHSKIIRGQKVKPVTEVTVNYYYILTFLFFQVVTKCHKTMSDIENNLCQKKVWCVLNMSWHHLSK